MRPTPDEALAVEKTLGARPKAWEPVRTGSHTPARRWVVTLPDGSTAFVKAAVDDLTTEWLRAEHNVYESLSGPFLPRLLGWRDRNDRPVLAIEDLSGAYWPPPWNSARIDAVLGSLEDVAHTPPPPDLVTITEMMPELNGWTQISESPEPALGLGLFTEAWLDEALPTLLAAEAGAHLDGDALLHFDVRSDNLCVRGDRAVLVDWNWACLGNPVFDVAAWLPSLQAEGGPAPEAILPEVDSGIPAVLAGFWVSHAARPPIPTAPHVRPMQLKQARFALPWAIRALELPPML